MPSQASPPPHSLTRPPHFSLVNARRPSFPIVPLARRPSFPVVPPSPALIFFSGLALRRSFAFLVRRTGAKVSGRKRKPSSVQDPAKIIMTQNTQCQPRELVVMLEG